VPFRLVLNEVLFFQGDENRRFIKVVSLIAIIFMQRGRTLFHCFIVLRKLQDDNNLLKWKLVSLYFLKSSTGSSFYREHE
jgi:hypothetical protein